MRCRSCEPLPEEVRRAADLLERRWTVSVIWASHAGAVRFGEFMQSLGSIPPATLTTRLTELEQAGILERATVEGRPPRTEYRLTARGEELRGLIAALRAFARSLSDRRTWEDGAVKPREIQSWLMDMDGVLVHEDKPIPGAAEFIDRLRACGLPFLVLTNNSIFTRRDLAARLAASGLQLEEEAIWTSALATANFLDSQRPGGTAFAIGEAGLTTALAQRRLHAHGAGPRVRGARRDAHLQLRADRPGDPPHLDRRALHRHESRSRPGRPRTGRCPQRARSRR